MLHWHDARYRNYKHKIREQGKKHICFFTVSNHVLVAANSLNIGVVIFSSANGGYRYHKDNSVIFKHQKGSLFCLFFNVVRLFPPAYFNGVLARRPPLYFVSECDKIYDIIRLGKCLCIDGGHLFSSFTPANSNLLWIFVALPMSTHVHCGDNNANKSPCLNRRSTMSATLFSTINDHSPLF